jgi:two-component system sensor histidine kinase VicK
LTYFPNGQISGEASGIEVIQDAHDIQLLYNNLVRSAKHEILLFLPTTSAFLREEKIGIIQSLLNAALRGVTVKILTPSDEKIEPTMKSLFRRDGDIQLRRMRHKADSQGSHEARTKILIVDKKEYLIVELKDDSKETFVEAVRLAIYSSTESTVKSYLTLVESLWEQAELYDHLEAHEIMQREFINIAAHELRTPMQPIIALIEILQHDLEAGNNRLEITRDELGILARNALRLERLATDILEVSRIESNTLRLAKEVFDLNEKIRNVVRDFETSTRGKGLRIKSQTGEPLIVEADKVRIFEVLSNLIRNAVRFTKEGSIVITAERNGESAQVEVKDTGSGIDPEIMPRLFTKFATKSEQGTGLGLYLSKKIVEAHGGSIWAKNNEGGRGAAFVFTIPIGSATT